MTVIIWCKEYISDSNKKVHCYNNDTGSNVSNNNSDNIIIINTNNNIVFNIRNILLSQDE